MNPKRVTSLYSHKLLVGLAVLQFIWVDPGWALDPAKTIFQFNCQSWVRQNGLPAGRINTVTQTRDGYIWLGTKNGLVRFDGLEFKAIPIELPAAGGQEVEQLTATGNGKLEFAINHGGFGSYDGEKFSTIGDARWSNPSMGAKTIFGARDGAIWTGANLGNGRWVETNPAASFFDTTNTGAVLSICEDAAGHIALGTAGHGLYYWADGKYVPFPDAGLKKQDIVAVAVDQQNQVWVSSGFDLSCYDTNGQIKAFPHSYVRALLVDSHGILWAGTWGGGVARYTNGKFDYLRKADGLCSDNVISLFEDAEGGLWVGTQDGLSKLSDLKFPIFTDKEGLSWGSGHCVAASKIGGLWVATDTGLDYFNGWTFTNYLDQSLLPNKYVKQCFEARNGDLYVSDGNLDLSVVSNNRLLARFPNSNWPTVCTEDSESVLVGVGDKLFRIKSGKMIPYQYKRESLPDYYWISALCVAKDGAIWVASNNGVFRLLDGTFQHWGPANGLSGNGVLWIFEDASDGYIWAGLTTGLARIKNGFVKNIRAKDGLPDDQIFAVVPDDLGFFWCDSDRGIFRASRRTLNDFADGKVPKVECELYDGVEAVKFVGRTDQGNSGCKTPDGRIWFPCPSGVVMIDPAHIPINRTALPVHIENLLANGRDYTRNRNVVVPPGRGDLEIHFTALTFIAPQKIRFRYQLGGYDRNWVETTGRRVAFYTNLKPGRYTFRVRAANSDGIWNEAGDTITIEMRPHFYETLWFDMLCGGLALAALAGLYAWRIRHLKLKHRALQKARDQLETEVRNRTAELATTNTSLQHEVEEHRRTSAQLAKRTKLLENEIAERERMQQEIERVHRRLLEISHQAGMAEVATNVLHNVGNVLNSVNISATVVTANAKNSRVSFLVKIAALLEDHPADLEIYLTSDPKGRQLPGYLKQLAEHLTLEQQNTIEELDRLRANVEHIKEIVAMQQSYATAAGFTELVNLPELVEDALRMDADSLDRHGVELKRDFTEVPGLVVEKHKALQILLNLIRNAERACDDSGRVDKQLKIKISKTADTVAIAVLDNGVGIPPENMTRIFNHGFTTRKDGHGFGLHSSALAAVELGGSLTAHSDGPGCGATFTLHLPLQAQKQDDFGDFGDGRIHHSAL